MKLLRRTDIREHGSGNAGATNFFRVSKQFKIKFSGFLTIIVAIIDISKGFFPVYLSYEILQNNQLCQINDLHKIFIGIFTILGHIFPIYLKFKGGKGVLTSAGVILALAPTATLFAISIGLIVIGITKIVSLGSLIGAFSLPIFVIFFNFSSIYLLIFTILAFLLILYTHRTNIKRIRRGTERKIF